LEVDSEDSFACVGCGGAANHGGKEEVSSRMDLHLHHDDGVVLVDLVVQVKMEIANEFVFCFRLNR
jgi:hypothetical protein